MGRHVLLTGGNGYIGSHILAELLRQGFSVCCAVRSQEKGDKILRDFTAEKQQISFTVVPDITAPEAYHQAVQGSPPFEAVFHAASPFSYEHVKRNLEFLDNAIKGTLNILTAVRDKAPSVRRVIWTGSCASVINYGSLTSNPPRLYTEQDWNPLTWDDAVHGDLSTAYRASKLFAEQQAWKFMKTETTKFDLVTLCPPATFGPLRHSINSTQDLNESNLRLWKMCFSSTKDAPVPYIPVHTYVDVRDLAIAQVRAMVVPDAGNERFIVCARQFHFQQICDILRVNLPKLDQRTPLGEPGTSSLPVGAYDIDNSKVKKVLGVEFRELKETILDVARNMLDIEQGRKQVLQEDTAV